MCARQRRSWSRRAGVKSCRSLHFRPDQEPESKFYVQAGAGVNVRVCPRVNQNFNAAFKISVTMFVVLKQNGIDWNVFSDQRRHISLWHWVGLPPSISPLSSVYLASWCKSYSAATDAGVCIALNYRGKHKRKMAIWGINPLETNVPKMGTCF